MFGSILAGLGGCAFGAIGILALLAPRLSSSQYGLPTTDRAALAFVRAVGARDLVLGIITLRLLATQQNRALAIVLGVSVIAAAGDAAAVASGRDDARPAHLCVHAGGAAALLTAWFFLRNSR